MQKFKCPWCGARPQTEFTYVIDEEGIPAASWPSESAEAQVERIYLRSNAVGFHNEIWQHEFGCRGWLKISRHNLTHKVESCTPVATATDVDK